MKSGEDEALRLLALDRLGALGPPLAREALESGSLEVRLDVVAWSGTMGAMHGHLVVLWLDPTLCELVQSSPSTVDSLTAAVAAAIASTSGDSLADLKILASDQPRSRTTAYRGRL